jgi:hypothetical protein
MPHAHEIIAGLWRPVSRSQNPKTETVHGEGEVTVDQSVVETDASLLGFFHEELCMVSFPCR